MIDIRQAAQQKPVAWMVKLGDVTCFQHHADRKHASVPLYTTPPQRPWVGLTPEEVQFYALKHRQLVNAHYDSASDTNIITAAFETTVFYETVEQALKERNHG
jgi:hypothetical protein